MDSKAFGKLGRSDTVRGILSSRIGVSFTIRGVQYLTTAGRGPITKRAETGTDDPGVEIEVKVQR